MLYGGRSSRKDRQRRRARRRRRWVGNQGNERRDKDETSVAHDCSGVSRKLRMRPEHEERRKIIREWMLQPKEKRQTKEQAEAFAKKVKDRVPCSGDPYG
jgi:hypothetical protein